MVFFFLRLCNDKISTKSLKINLKSHQNYRNTIKQVNFAVIFLCKKLILVALRLLIKAKFLQVSQKQSTQLSHQKVICVEIAVLFQLISTIKILSHSQNSKISKSLAQSLFSQFEISLSLKISIRLLVDFGALDQNIKAII